MRSVAAPTSPEADRTTLVLNFGDSLVRTLLGEDESKPVAADVANDGEDDEDDEAPIAAVLEKRRTVMPARSSVAAPSKLSLGPVARSNDFGLRSFGIGPPSPSSSEDDAPVRPRARASSDDDEPIGAKLGDDDVPLGLANPAAAVQQQMMAAYQQQLAFAQQYAAMAAYMPPMQMGMPYQASVLADEDLPPGFVAPAMFAPPPPDPSIDRWRQGVAYDRSPAGSVI